MLKGILKSIFWTALLVALGGAGGAVGLYVFRSGEGVFLPQVTGLDVVRALELLGEKGIPMQVTGRAFSDAVSMNHVVSQNPPCGRRIRKGRIGCMIPYAPSIRFWASGRARGKTSGAARAWCSSSARVPESGRTSCLP